MRILKLKRNGDQGAVLLKSSTLQHKPAYGDEYCVAVDALGIDDNGDPLGFRLTLTRNEIAFLHGLATQTA